MKTPSVLLFALVLSAALACGSSEPAPRAPTTETSPAPAGNSLDEASSSEPLQMCRQLLVRQRDCQDDFLPALVALRVELDRPEGIAASDAAEGREALLAGAREEYAEDSTDEAIEASCDKVVAQVGAEKIEEMRPAGEECLAQAECPAFVDCVLELQKPFL